MVALQRRYVVGFGRGKEDAIDARAEQEPQETAPAETERSEDRLERQALIGKGVLPIIKSTQHVDQDNLAVDAARESCVNNGCTTTRL
jgi:hypothetical protein